MHLTQTQTVGVLQEVAEQFEQGALLHGHYRVFRDIQADLHLLVAVDLGQGAAQAFKQRLQGHLVTHQTTLAQAGALQLVVDLLAHAFDLAL